MKCEQELFDNEEEGLSAFNNTYSEDGKLSLEILKAIYHCDFKKVKKIKLDTGPREYIWDLLIEIDKRFEDFFYAN